MPEITKITGNLALLVMFAALLVGAAFSWNGKDGGATLMSNAFIAICVATQLRPGGVSS